MNIGISVASETNLYLPIFIQKLKLESISVTCIICRIHDAQPLKLEIKKYFFEILQKIFKKKKKQIKNNFKNQALQNYTYENKIKIYNSGIKSLLKSECIDLVYVKDFNTKILAEYIKKNEIDVIINLGGGIFRKMFISAPNIGILNTHMAFLPKFRGMNVLEWSLFYNEDIGVSTHFIDEGIDTGDILEFKKIEIERGDNIDTLRAKASVINIESIIKCINNIKNNEIKRIKQTPEEGNQYFVMHKRLKDLVNQKLKISEL